LLRTLELKAGDLGHELEHSYHFSESDLFGYVRPFFPGHHAKTVCRAPQLRRKAFLLYVYTEESMLTPTLKMLC
jgi:hypothetical protein